MPKNARFWRNVALIGLAHTAVVAGLIHWSRENKSAPAQTIVWMNGGGADGGGTAKTTAFPTARAKSPQPDAELKTEPLKASESDDRLVLTSAKSDIQLPNPKPSPTSAATPKVSATPKVKVTAKPAPKPKPRPTATAKPKPSPRKLLLAKASPKPSASRTENKAEDTDAKEQTVKESPATALGRSDSQAGAGKGAPTGADGGYGGGGSNESQFGWYGSMLHDRLYTEWVQPTNVATSGAKNSVLAKLRIEKDGRVSQFEIIRPSGNAAVDESVATVGKRVTQVEPLPPGLGTGEHYDVKITFELSSE